MGRQHSAGLRPRPLAGPAFLGRSRDHSERLLHHLVWPSWRYNMSNAVITTAEGNQRVRLKSDLLMSVEVRGQMGRVSPSCSRRKRQHVSKQSGRVFCLKHRNPNYFTYSTSPNESWLVFQHSV